MDASKYTEVIEGRQRFIATGILDFQEAAGDGSINNYGDSSDEYYESDLAEASVSI